MYLALNNLQWLICHKNPTKPNHIYLIYMYKEDLALNNLQWVICHKTKPIHSVRFQTITLRKGMNPLIHPPQLRIK